MKSSKRVFVMNSLAVGVRTALGSLALVLSTTALAQQAQSSDDEDTQTLETVSVLGTRGTARTATDSAVPIDIIKAEELHNQGSTDVLDALKVVVPSFNVSTIPIDDAATLIRPANLRGLPPDNTLILVNGKRRHRSAVITFLGHGLSDGSQGVDISVFPSLALDQVEVLRDGAAAQYGSDAIAGVINFGLKRLNQGGQVEIFGGEHYDGDGLSKQVDGQIGFPLGPDGFATLTAEWREADPTSRSVQRDDAAAAIAAGYPNVPNPAQIWGSPEVKSDHKFVGNFGWKGENVEIYGFGNLSKRETEGGFYYRNPTARAGVYSNDGGQTLLVGALNGNASSCPTIALRNAAGNLIPYATVAGQVAALPSNCFTFLNVFTGGFTPRFGGEMKDLGLTAGIKGMWGNDWYWDFSGSYGNNEIDFTMRNTVNASLGPNQPAGYVFHPGSNEQTEHMFNFDLRKSFDRFNLALGTEWRREEFRIGAGDAASTAIGPLTQQGFSIGSNGFPGFNQQTAGEFGRDSWAVYADLESQVTDKFLVAGAVRYEDYEDFGSTSNWKLTGRYDFNSNWALRGALSTGFRAPTPGQANVSQITTAFIDGELRDTATLPPTNRIAAFYGAEPLTPEESENASLGLVWTNGPWNLTADYYHINVDDRIARSTDFTITAADRAALIAAGVVQAASISRVGFFVNDFDTTTQGIDLVASVDTDHFGGETSYTAAFNWNDTEVKDFTPGIISEARIKKLKESLPSTKGYFSIHHHREVWDLLVRVNYYGSWYEDHLDSDVVSIADGGLPIYEDSAVTVDIETGWKWDSGLFVRIGAQNVFDKTPDDNPWGAPVAGAKYPVHSPYGFNGGFYYARVGWKF
ncbi:MAG: TonB-dependent receptor [Rhodanobacteraceae bacterium]|nr:TonB-dependent receptor [Rhodanobacteraceae bacterium]